jgi:hypothetical protein
MATRRSGLVVVAATFSAATQGDAMTNAKASKLNKRDQLASKSQSAADRRPSDKSTRTSKLKTVVAPKPAKIDKIIALMRRPKGASINELTKATAWQAHSVRGAISGALRKKQGLNVVSEKSGDIR